MFLKYTYTSFSCDMINKLKLCIPIFNIFKPLGSESAGYSRGGDEEISGKIVN